MNLVSKTLKLFFKYRLSEIENIKKDPIKAQKEVLLSLIDKALDTEFGRINNFDNISDIPSFQKNVSLSSYEDMYPYISRMMNGEKDILWPGLVSWFAKSSGTTNDRSKFIPVSEDSLEECHFKAGRDELVLYIKNNPETKIFEGKSVFVGGSFSQIKNDPDIFCGDISAIMMKNLPPLGEYLRTPSLKTALLADYEKKIDQLAEEVSKENVVSIAGVPTWSIFLIKKVMEKNEGKNIFEIWPNFEVFFHGAVSFTPYEKLFNELLPSKNMHYMEAYNASEGFFAIEDDPKRKGEMMLMPDYGIFYEFIPMEEFGKENPKVLTMEEVEIGKNYAIVISTNAGLWRYIIGDTVSFTTLYPHRVKITGRTKHFINAFGEEVIIDNTDKAIAEACKETNSLICEYTVAPVFIQDGKNGCHEWLIEFEKEPESLELFVAILDNKLREINSDYDAKRFNDIALSLPNVKNIPSGTFHKWMKQRGKFGGQNKVPRLSNTREYVDEILKIC
ncbi:MAG: GH3 auxin-responsive promoter family protein [bacterium]